MSSSFQYTPPTPTFGRSNNSYIPRSPGQRTYAIGDVHGDLPKLLLALITANLVTQVEATDDPTLADFRWSGGDSVLVQVGDILDRGR